MPGIREMKSVAGVVLGQKQMVHIMSDANEKEFEGLVFSKL